MLDTNMPQFPLLRGKLTVLLYTNWHKYVQAIITHITMSYNRITSESVLNITINYNIIYTRRHVNNNTASKIFNGTTD